MKDSDRGAMKPPQPNAFFPLETYLEADKKYKEKVVRKAAPLMRRHLPKYGPAEGAVLVMNLTDELNSGILQTTRRFSGADLEETLIDRNNRLDQVFPAVKNLMRIFDHSIGGPLGIARDLRKELERAGKTTDDFMDIIIVLLQLAKIKRSPIGKKPVGKPVHPVNLALRRASDSLPADMNLNQQSKFLCGLLNILGFEKSESSIYQHLRDYRRAKI